MDGLLGQEGWRWIFYIEGSVTVIVGALSYFFINDFPSDRPRFLTEEECNRVISRLRTDAGPGANELFSWTQIASAFLDWKIYIWSLCGISITIPFLSLSLFCPTIITNLGFFSYQAQLLSAPPYAFAFITTMITAYFSDKYSKRGIFIICWSIVSTASYLVLVLVDSFTAKYFAVFFAVGSLSPSTSICISFLSCNVSPQMKRATAIAFLLSVCNIGGIIAGQIYRSHDAPRFILGHCVNLVCCVLTLLTASLLVFYLRYENRRRDRLFSHVSFSTIANSSRGAVDLFGLGSAEDRQRWGCGNLSEQQIRNLGDRHVAWRYML
jgi:sugar phosphate permease